MQLKGKIVLVTGASKGIGKTIAIAMAKQGADVIVNYHSDQAGAQEAVTRIEALGVRARAVQADIGKVDQLKAMFSVVKKEFGCLDVLINNAAVTGWTNLFEITEEKWDMVIDTNLKGTFFCSLEAARMMKDSGGGTIVNVSTNCAELGVKNLVAYASSKGGVHAMTKQLAVELAPYAIRVNTFAPGPTNVERNLRDDENYRDTWGSVVPLGRTAETEEMVGPALFLASDQSSYVTGQVFFADGGWTIQGKLPADYFDTVSNKNT